MSKLLFIFEGDMPTVSIMRDVFTHLDEYPNIKSDFMYMSDVKPMDIDSHDIIVFIRPSNIYSWKIAENAKKAGHIVITFCDDDLLNLPDSNPMMPWRKKGLLKCLSLSDGVWSSSQYILNNYKGLTAGGRTIMSDTIVRPDELEGIDVQHNNAAVKIVYASGGDHAVLFEKYIKPIVQNLKNEFGNSISFTFVGVHPDMDEIECEYVSGMPLMEYRRYMREQNFDIGLAPLHTDSFSKCKYFNKFLEYTTQGIVGIYTKTEPYTYVIKDAENGFLVENTPESWFRTIKQVINNKPLREQCVENAIRYIKENHSQQSVVERIICDLPEFAAESKNYKKCESFSSQKLKYNLSRPFDWIYLTGFYLKRTGVKDVADRAKRKITRANSYSRRKNK